MEVISNARVRTYEWVAFLAIVTNGNEYDLFALPHRQIANKLYAVLYTFKIMGLEINYWDCKFSDYDESWDGEEETRYYYCSHKEGCGTCDLDNKWHDKTAFCKIAENE